MPPPSCDISTPRPAKSRQHIFQLRQFHLQLAFAGFRMPRKNVEDELRAVNHPLVQDALDIALLGRREIVVKQNQVGIGRSRRSGNLLQLAAADQGSRIGTVAPLQNLADYDRARAGRQRAQFVQRFLRAELRNAGSFYAAADAGRGIPRRLRSGGERALAGLRIGRA